MVLNNQHAGKKSLMPSTQRTILQRLPLTKPQWLNKDAGTMTEQKMLSKNISRYFYTGA